MYLESPSPGTLSQKIGKPNNLNVFRINKTKGISRIAKIDKDHIYLREENISLDNNNERNFNFFF